MLTAQNSSIASPRRTINPSQTSCSPRTSYSVSSGLPFSSALRLQPCRIIRRPIDRLVYGETVHITIPTIRRFLSLGPTSRSSRVSPPLHFRVGVVLLSITGSSKQKLLSNGQQRATPSPKKQSTQLLLCITAAASSSPSCCASSPPSLDTHLHCSFLLYCSPPPHSYHRACSIAHTKPLQNFIDLPW